MAEMDIYMRRRLVALGGLVLFFILFVLLIKSCGGDEEAEPVAPAASTTGATGASGAALGEDEFIAQADAICDPSNTAVGQLDPAETDATQDEFAITSDELNQLESLELAERSPGIQKFLSDLGAVVDALRAKAKAAKSGDVAAQDEAQVAIDTAEVEAREAGERAGFRACGDFLDAGESPGGGGGGASEEAEVPAPTDTGAVAPPADTGTVAPPADTGTVAPPVDDGTTTPPPDDDGGDTGGGITP